MSEAVQIVEQVRRRLGKKVLATEEFRGDETVVLSSEGLLESFRALKNDDSLNFDFLADLTAVDYWGRKEPRFEVVYHLSSFETHRRLRVKVPVPEENPTVPSLTPLWPGANWLEREAWDMFGIRFEGHPDLRRILLYEQFQGHPLRKDYPVNQWQPLVPERQVEGTFVDERSRNKLLRLKHALANKG